MDKALVVKTRRLEMELFEKMGVYKKAQRSEVKRLGGKIISARWIDTDKGHRGTPIY